MFNEERKSKFLETLNNPARTKSIFESISVVEERHGIDCSEFSVKEMDEYFSIGDNGVSTIRSAKSCLNQYSKWCAKNGLVEFCANYMSYKPEFEMRKKYFLSIEEFRESLEIVLSHEKATRPNFYNIDWCVFNMMWYGLSSDEIVSLRREDYNRETGEFLISSRSDYSRIRIDQEFKKRMSALLDMKTIEKSKKGAIREEEYQPSEWLIDYNYTEDIDRSNWKLRSVISKRCEIEKTMSEYNDDPKYAKYFGVSFNQKDINKNGSFWFLYNSPAKEVPSIKRGKSIEDIKNAIQRDVSNSTIATLSVEYLAWRKENSI